MLPSFEDVGNGKEGVVFRMVLGNKKMGEKRKAGYMA
jgi:hypothetical protein